MSDRANGNDKNDEARKPRSSGFSQMNWEGKEGGFKSRNQAMLRMGRKGKVVKTLRRDYKGANATKDCNVPFLPGHRQLSHVQLESKE